MKQGIERLASRASSAVMAAALALLGVPWAAFSCDEACLQGAMSGFLKAMTTGAHGSVPLAAHAEIRENGKPVSLGETVWKGVHGIRSVMTFADPVTGNVVSRAGVELEGLKPGYISTRLEIVAGGHISDVELSADTSNRVAAGYVWKLDPEFSAVLPL